MGSCKILDKVASKNIDRKRKKTYRFLRVGKELSTVNAQCDSKKTRKKNQSDFTEGPCEPYPIERVRRSNLKMAAETGNVIRV